MNKDYESGDCVVKKIILRSASPRRRDLLEEANYAFEVCASDIDEQMNKNQTPYQNVKELGLRKAAFEQEKYYGNILIGCDTIVVLNDVIYGKPHDSEDAYHMLKTLSGKTHQVMSGVGIIYKEKVYNFVCVSNVSFRNLSDEEIRDYIATKECFGKAGSYAIQGIGRNLIQSYDGSLSNIIGLPMEEIKRVLDEIYGMED